MHEVDRTANQALDTGLAFIRWVRNEARKRMPEGLTNAQFRFLHMIVKEPTRPLSETAQDMCVSPAAATKMVDSLEARGLLVRTADPRDRRRALVETTPAGEALVAATRQDLVGQLRARLQGLDAAQIASLHSTLRTLQTILAPEVTP